jgi:hypothetical protein
MVHEAKQATLIALSLALSRKFTCRTFSESRTLLSSPDEFISSNAFIAGSDARSISARNASHMSWRTFRAFGHVEDHGGAYARKGAKRAP